MRIEFIDDIEADRWKPTNDAVMGGMSEGQLKISGDDTGLFYGHLSLENNGGFCLIHRQIEENSFKNCAGVLLKVKGDGRSYQFRVKLNNQKNSIAYRMVFKTIAQQFKTIRLPFDQFCASYRGQIIPDAAELDFNKIKQISFLLADKQQGSFCLEIGWINSF